MSPDFFNWIEQHFSDDPAKLRLKFRKERGDEILQIEMRRKHSAKFAQTLKDNPNFIFPTSLAAEQSTSDRLAQFHASLIQPADTVADLTAGLGIDAMYFARKAKFVIAVERNEVLADALRANGRSFSNLEVITGDCRDIITSWVNQNKKFDIVFIDPARRDANGARVFALKDCEPDVTALLPEIKKITSNLIIKASPMLDISHTVLELTPHVSQIFVLGTPTECKELVAVCELKRNEIVEPLIHAVTIKTEGISDFEFTRSEENEAKTVFGVPMEGQYVFDPYPALMKAAPNKLISQRYGLTKIGANTHLWFADSPVADFPGNIYRILEVLPYMSKHIKRYASRFPKVAVTSRNFDISSDSLRAKLKVTEGPMRLFAVNAFDGRKLLITCEKI